jgi:hypothetical protein
MPISICYPGGRVGPGVLADLSVRGASVLAPATPLIGDVLTLRIGDIGDLTARVSRLSPQGFGTQLASPVEERRRLADALTIILNRPGEGSRAVRYPQSREAVLELESGAIVAATVLDCSSSGARLETAALPPIGAKVLLGARRGIVERHLSSGIALSFVVGTP